MTQTLRRESARGVDGGKILLLQGLVRFHGAAQSAAYQGLEARRGQAAAGLFGDQVAAFQDLPGDEVVAYVRPEDISVLRDEDDGTYRNLVEGNLDQIIFEGSTAQLHVDVAGQLLRVDVSGAQRLHLLDHRGHVRLGFDEVTLIPNSVKTSAGPHRSPAGGR